MSTVGETHNASAVWIVEQPQGRILYSSIYSLLAYSCSLTSISESLFFLLFLQFSLLFPSFYCILFSFTSVPLVASKKKENKKKTKSKGNASDEEDGPVDGTSVLIAIQVSSTKILSEIPGPKGKKGKGDVLYFFLEIRNIFYLFLSVIF